MKLSQSGERKEKRMKKSYGHLKDVENIINGLIYALWESQKEGTERAESLFEEMTEKFLNMRKETDIQIQETQLISSNMNPEKSILKHIIIKLSKVKDRKC